jgi:hypothetical protein
LKRKRRNVSVITYFKDEKAQNRALEACKDFLGGRAWAVKDRLNLYSLSREAFGANKNAASFRRIYDELVRPASADGWGIARNAGGPLWSSEKTFEVLKTDFTQFAWGGGITLLNVRSGSEAALMPLLEKMRQLKPLRSASNWPLMAVSKVLHFFNAELFPVYDNEVIWNRVLTRFLNEFKAFCRTSSPPYDGGYTPAFYKNYMNWGNALLASAHPRFMQGFADWLGGQDGANLPGRPFDPTRLYATAYEFTIIGAYAAESGEGQHGAADTVAHCKAG